MTETKTKLQKKFRIQQNDDINEKVTKALDGEQKEK